MSEVAEAVALKFVPLSEAAEINPKVDRTLLEDDTLVSFVPMAAVGAADGQIDVSTHRPYAEVKKGYTAFRNGDVLFAKVTPCMENGKMAVARNLCNGQGFGSTEFHVLRPREGVDSSYLYHFVSSASFRKEAARHMTGAVGLRRVPSAFLQGELIPLPELGEQCRIVAEIEKQFSRLDEAVANLQRVKVNLKRYKAAVLKAAVEGRLVGIAAGESFQQVPLGSIVDLNPRLIRGALDDEAEVSFVPMAAVGADDGSMRAIDTRRYADVKKGYTYFSDGDVLFAKVTPCMENGKMVVASGLAGGHGFGSTEFHVLRAKEEVVPQYVYYLVSSELFRKEAARHMTGAVGLRRVPSAFLQNVAVPVPSGPVQRRLVAEIDRRFSILRRVEAEVDINLQRAQALRQATLRRAFLGMYKNSENSNNQGEKQ